MLLSHKAGIQLFECPCTLVKTPRTVTLIHYRENELYCQDPWEQLPMRESARLQRHGLRLWLGLWLGLQLRLWHSYDPTLGTVVVI